MLQSSDMGLAQTRGTLWNQFPFGCVDPSTMATDWLVVVQALSTADPTLQRAGAYLSSGLLCYDLPATDSKIMGAKIDRRLSEE